MNETTTARDLLAEAMHEAMCCNDPEKVVVDGFREAADDLLLLTDWQDAIVAERVAAAKAAALREFADWWEDAANADEMRGLADRHYSIGGPSMPAIVARLRAAALTDPRADA